MPAICSSFRSELQVLYLSYDGLQAALALTKGRQGCGGVRGQVPEVGSN